jgi:hypothetical protein
MKDYTFGLSRRFIVGGIAAAASFYLAAVGRGALKACHQEDIGSAPPSDFQSLIKIGNSYLNDSTRNGELDTLDELFLDETETRPAAIVRAVQRRLLAMKDQVRDEFARYDTVICDGWVLAKSEARLCATIAARVRRL